MAQHLTREEENRLFAWFEATTGRAWESLSVAENAVWRVYLFELQVANGGFHQAFLNDGDKWRETLSALRRIGAVTITQMFEEALSVFPNASPASDQSERYAQISALNTNAMGLLHRLDGEYYELWRSCPEEDCYAKMYTFLKSENLIA